MTRFFRSVFNFYINSNIHVAVAMFSFVKITLLNNAIYENKTPFFVSLATVISYNFIRVYKLEEIDLYSSVWIKLHQKPLILLNLIAFILLVVLTFFIRFEAILVLIPFMLTTFFYIVPFHEDQKNLRSIAGLKLFLIALTGAGVTVLFPLIHNEIQLEQNEWILFFQRILFIIAYTIPFDIRDKDDDHILLKTLPQLYGTYRSKIYGSTALLGFFLLEFVKFPLNISSIVITAVISIVSFLLLLFTQTEQNRNYTAFWIESLPVFWLLLIQFL